MEDSRIQLLNIIEEKFRPLLDCYILEDLKVQAYSNIKFSNIVGLNKFPATKEDNYNYIIDLLKELEDKKEYSEILASKTLNNSLLIIKNFFMSSLAVTRVIDAWSNNNKDRNFIATELLKIEMPAIGSFKASSIKLDIVIPTKNTKYITVAIETLCWNERENWQDDLVYVRIYLEDSEYLYERKSVKLKDLTVFLKSKIERIAKYS